VNLFTIPFTLKIPQISDLERKTLIEPAQTKTIRELRNPFFQKFIVDQVSSKKTNALQLSFRQGCDDQIGTSELP
jgi:hypothetical protein